MNNLILQPVYWASVSGGKDSLYMLKLIWENPERYPLHGVIHYELDIDYPFIQKVIDYMQRECAMRSIPFIRIRPINTWKELYNQYGFPSSRVRWCNNKYKLSAQKEFERYLRKFNERPIFYIGFCADEKRRFKPDENIYPLAENDIAEDTILKWARDVPIFNGFYRLFKRCGCMKCPMQTYKETAYIYIKYPELYNEMIEQARKTEQDYFLRTGKKISCWDGHAKYDSDYRDYIVKTKWAPRVLEELGKMEDLTQ